MLGSGKVFSSALGRLIEERRSLVLSSSLFFLFIVFLSSSTGTLPYDIKIVIAGNHELTFDQEFMADLIKQDFYYFPSASKLKPENYENVQSMLTNCIYLQDSEVTVRGFRIYGTPWWVMTWWGLFEFEFRFLSLSHGEINVCYPASVGYFLFALTNLQDSGSHDLVCPVI